MKKSLLYLLILLSSLQISAQDTFSIIAVDTLTGEIGGAGASCIDENAIPTGVLIINDIIPNRGGIHTQAYWNSTNQQNARNRMLEWLSPEEIIDWLVANDVQNNPTIRQYGVVDFEPVGTGARSAAHTGANCNDYKDHITGPNYAIQGNILLGQHILDSMEARFLNTPGTLAEKLMASLQGANVPGADTRCLNEGVSSLSAFVRVWRPDDPAGTYWCDLLVPSTPYGVEPIDSLQVLFDEWLIWTGTSDKPYVQPNRLKIYPNPALDQITIEISKAEGKQYTVQVYSMSGFVMDELIYKGEPILLNTVEYQPGIYLCKILSKDMVLDVSRFSILRE